jgi:hypothetical protein
MTLAERVLVIAAGYQNGWEVEDENLPERVLLRSAIHPAAAVVRQAEAGGSSAGPVFAVSFSKGPPLLSRELARAVNGGPPFVLSGYHALAAFLSKAASLAASLPNSAEETYVRRVEELNREAMAQPPSVFATEALRLTRQRVGQDVFREALTDYWGGACAVTGIAVPEVLRASHAKPWADCESDAERLDVFNGFLLCANLDALFDRGLITFGDDGGLVVSERLASESRCKLGLTEGLRARWIAPEHGRYLAWHRERVFGAPI